MKARGLLVAAIVLAALTSTLYWSNHHKSVATSADSTLESSPRILTVPPAEVTGLSIRKKSGDRVMLAQNNTGQWQITAPKTFSADQDAVSSVLSALSSLNSDRLVEDKATNLDQYGLAQPSIEVEIKRGDNKSQDLRIGDDTPTGNGAYAAVAGDPRVFIIASYNKNAFVKLNKNTSTFRKRRGLRPLTDIDLAQPEYQAVCCPIDVMTFLLQNLSQKLTESFVVIYNQDQHFTQTLQ